MTHTLHRRGTEENLSNDYLVLPFGGQHFEDYKEKRERFIEICLKQDPVNKDNLCDFRIYVFDSKEKAEKVLRELTEAELGISIVVSGLYDMIGDLCHKVGIKPHTINYSLGFWGNAKNIPEQRLAELTTMCGHSLIAPGLALDMAKRVAKGFPAATASEKMGKMCLCEIFNTKRGEELLKKLAVDINSGTYAA